MSTKGDPTVMLNFDLLPSSPLPCNRNLLTERREQLKIMQPGSFFLQQKDRTRSFLMYKDYHWRLVMKRMCTLLSVLMMVIGLSVSAHAALVDMHDGTIYDTDTQLSWLKNANTAGAMDWSSAVAWAASLNTLNSGQGFAGLTGWRLPTKSDTCSGYNCTGSEMGHLYYTEGVTLSNPGPFMNVQSDDYWSGTECALNSPGAWTLYFGNGNQDCGRNKDVASYALAVRPGARSVSVSVSVPTMNEWGMIIFVVLAGLGSVYYMRKLKRA